HEFNQLAKEELRKGWMDNRYHIQAVAMTFASRGMKPQYGLDLNLNPKDCPLAWLKQRAYVAKIEWLDSLGKTKEAAELREEYRSEREKIAERVPQEFKKAFFDHPLYKVP